PRDGGGALVGLARLRLSRAREPALGLLRLVSRARARRHRAGQPDPAPAGVSDPGGVGAAARRTDRAAHLRLRRARDGAGRHRHAPARPPDRGRAASGGAMSRAIAVRHVAFEDLGLLGPLLAARGLAPDYREAGIDDLA